jgi:hypothetical protein
VAERRIREQSKRNKYNTLPAAKMVSDVSSEQPSSRMMASSGTSEGSFSSVSVVICPRNFHLCKQQDTRK